MHNNMLKMIKLALIFTLQNLVLVNALLYPSTKINIIRFFKKMDTMKIKEEHWRTADQASELSQPY